MLLAAIVAALLALTACASSGPAGGTASPVQQDKPERGNDHGDGGMM